MDQTPNHTFIYGPTGVPAPAGLFFGACLSLSDMLTITVNNYIIDKYLCRVKVFSTANILNNAGKHCVKIEGKLPEGYVVLCDNGHEEHSFIVQNLNVSVECPKCGTTALSTNLVTEYTLRARSAQVKD